MKTLTSLERFHVDAAEGWLMLGNPVEAHEELENLSGDSNHHPVVLSMRWQVYAAAQWWEAAYVVAKALCELVPDSPAVWICQANTVRQYKGVGEGRKLLLTVVRNFPENAVIRYNLACYGAQMGLLEESCNWLVSAFELEDSSQLKLAAIYDPDLQPLWEKIGRKKVQEVTGLVLSLEQVLKEMPSSATARPAESVTSR